jgi:hypothetical protein
MFSAAWMSAITGARSATNSAAFADTAAPNAVPFFPARRRLVDPFGLPYFTPRAFATARAFFVLREIASRSAWATRAMMPTLRSFAGMSTATNRTPLSRRARRKAAVRESQSSFAMTDVDSVILASCSLRQIRPVHLAPTPELSKPRQNLGTARYCEVVDQLALSLQPKPTGPLPGRGAPLVVRRPLSCRHILPLYSTA